MNHLYVGVDPGVNGGIALVNRAGKVVVVSKMHFTPQEVALFFREWKDSIKICLLERVGVMPGQGVSSSGKFMKNYGLLQGILYALEIPFVQMQPHRWQQALKIVKRDNTKPQSVHKNKLKRKAERLFPEETITLKTADALLLAALCRRQYRNKNVP